MRILHICNTNGGGGAGIAARRLHLGLLNHGIDSHFIAKKMVEPAENTYSSFSQFQKILDMVKPYTEQKLILRILGYNPESLFSYGLFRADKWMLRKLKELSPDIIHLHWINGGTMSLRDLQSLEKLNVPIVWTLHDAWPFTGGCHFFGECRNYREKCGSCPVLQSSKNRDLSRKQWEKKKKIFARLPLSPLAVGTWIKSEAEKSALFKGTTVNILPNVIDTDRFKGIDKVAARERLNLNQDERIILYGAPAATRDRRKGWDLLLDALNETRDWDKLLVFGDSQSAVTGLVPREKIVFLGNFSDEISLSLIYSAADVMVVPSRQETFGLTVLEAMACKTPVAAFRCTGPVDIITHKENGYLAEPFNVKDLAGGISWLMKNRNTLIRDNALRHVHERFSITRVIPKYIDFYTDLIEDVTP